MPEDHLPREVELLKEFASLPVLSSGLRSRVLAAALEAQDRRAQGGRVLASVLGLFALLVGVTWMGPFANVPSLETSENAGQMSAAFSTRFDGEMPDGEPIHGDAGVGTAGNRALRRGAPAASTLSSLHPSLNRGQVMMSVMGDDWQSVEEQLQSRQEHFPRFQM
jgi:hypothetical protein